MSVWGCVLGMVFLIQDLSVLFAESQCFMFFLHQNVPEREHIL